MSASSPSSSIVNETRDNDSQKYYCHYYIKLGTGLITCTFILITLQLQMWQLNCATEQKEGTVAVY